MPEELNMKLDPARLPSAPAAAPAPRAIHWIRTALLVLAALLSAPFVFAFAGKGRRR